MARRRMTSLILFAAGGVAIGALLPSEMRTVLGLAGPASQAREQHGGEGHGPGGKEDEHGKEGVINLPAELIRSAGIETLPAAGGTLAKRIAVPGTIVANAEQLSHVPAKIPGLLAEARKRLGDPVAAGEVVAVVESREIAEAKSDYLAAQRAEQLARNLFERENQLWQKRITAEQDFVKARTEAEEARIRIELARQKLFALGLRPAELAGIAGQQNAQARMHEIRAPITGHVIDRKAAIGASLTGDATIYIVADLSSVWVEMALASADLSLVRKGQGALITRNDGTSAEGQVIFVSPVVDQDTRTARAVALLDNKDGQWRPGDFVTAAIQTEALPVEVLVARSAVQNIGGESVVFVRTKEGFEKREVVLGRGDETSVEIVFGLDPGEAVATANTFLLKAELGKAEAEHSH